MDIKFENYLNEHKILKIGKIDLTDIIVDNPIEFVKFVSKTDYYISHVLWWEKIELTNAKNSMGGGGIRDKSDNTFFWSEIYYLGRDFCPEDESNVIISYIDIVRVLYPAHNLHPSFDLKNKFMLKV